MVARLNKYTVEEYMQKHIFGPLGMTSTTFRLEKYPEMEQRLVKMLQRSETGSVVQSVNPWPTPAEEDCAGAGLYSTSDDYLKVFGDLLQETPVLLKADTVKSMFAPQLAKNSPALQQLHVSIPVKAMTGLREVHESVNWGLGGAYIEEDVEDTKKGSLMWGGFPNLIWFANRTQGLAGLYASQLLPPMDPASSHLAHKFMEHVWQLRS
jgi:CubicO group peptidase (beta-lactamase class C family)